ncbi:MAG: prephenate dehydrogenase/arogenate dehydrogenase family protein [Acidimicrobiia bacterium]|nr:prephenate dehydrogenase/arogenate dehydrogenase family protein [Acidimicrobiia bacterium]
MQSLAAVLGTGLIGTSVAIALRSAGWIVRGYDPDGTALDVAARMGGVEPCDTIEDAVQGVDLIVLAGPVGAIIETLGFLETDALVTDVAGVKRPVVEAGARLARFVGGHPMAGRESAGPDAASGGMFRGATWVLTTDGAADDDLIALSGIIQSLGAVPVQMSALSHDRAVAAASHIPHLTAVSLVNLVSREEGARSLVAGGFRDLTRVAASDPSWWSDVLIANGDAVSEELRMLAGSLVEMADLIDGRDTDEVHHRLDTAQRLRRGMAAPVAAVRVILEDRPGEIAEVGRALADSHVDLRDLQLRHAVHGGGGVLTLSVKPVDAKRLRTALSEAGFRLLES